MRYLITGGAGFIGSHLADYLIAKGHHVTIIDNLTTGDINNVNKACDLIIGDILDDSLLKNTLNKVDGCFHLAAIASVEKSTLNWIESHKVNLTGTISVFQQSAIYNIPVVYASSSAVYGRNADYLLTEDLQAKPISAYAVDKFSCEMQAAAFGYIHNLPTFGLRFFNVYGPRQSANSLYSSVITAFSKAIKSKQNIIIFGDGKQIRDFIHITDVVNFLYVAMNKSSNTAPIVNVSTGIGTDIKQLVLLLGGRCVDIEYLPARKGDILISVGSTLKAQQLLSLRANVRLLEGLKSLDI